MGITVLVGVRGESQINNDGTSRQEYIKKLKKGEKVLLVADPTNIHDRWAVKVLTNEKIQVGWLPSDARDASAVLRGEPISAKVHAVTGGTNWLNRLLGKKNVGLVLKISKEDPDWTKVCQLEDLAKPFDNNIKKAKVIEKSGDTNGAIQAYQDVMLEIRKFTQKNSQASAYRNLHVPIDRLSLLLERNKQYEQALEQIEKWENTFDPVQPTKNIRDSLRKRAERLRKRLDT